MIRSEKTSGSLTLSAGGSLSRTPPLLREFYDDGEAPPAPTSTAGTRT
jgi:hypothetical protein